MNNKDKDYTVPWQGAKLTKRHGNIVGLTIVFGIIGSFISVFTIGHSSKILGSILVFLFTITGFLLANLIYKK